MKGRGFSRLTAVQRQRNERLIEENLLDPAAVLAWSFHHIRSFLTHPHGPHFPSRCAFIASRNGPVSCVPSRSASSTAIGPSRHSPSTPETARSVGYHPGYRPARPSPREPWINHDPILQPRLQSSSNQQISRRAVAHIHLLHVVPSVRDTFPCRTAGRACDFCACVSFLCVRELGKYIVRSDDIGPVIGRDIGTDLSAGRREAGGDGWSAGGGLVVDGGEEAVEVGDYWRRDGGRRLGGRGGCCCHCGRGWGGIG